MAIHRSLLFAPCFIALFSATLAWGQLTNTSSATERTLPPDCNSEDAITTHWANWAFTDTFGTHVFTIATEVTPRVVVDGGGKDFVCPTTGITTSADGDSTDGDGYHLHAVGGNGAITYKGSITPKYIVLAVIYAPPGSKSTVDYGASTLLGTASALADSFTSGNSVTTSVSLGAGSSIFGVSFGDSMTSTASTSYTQQSDTSSSLSVNKINSSDIIVPGPASSAVGIDHSTDVVLVWLNPAANFSLTPGSGAIQWTNLAFDARDPAGDMDVVPLQLAQLENPALISSATQQSLDRSWAGPGGALTGSDLLTIAARDPFSNPSYTVNVGAGSSCSSDGRFCLAGSQDFPYQPPAPGGQPITEKMSAQYQTTATSGQAATDTYQVGFTTDLNAHAAFLQQFSIDVKTSNTFSWMNKWSSTRTNTAGQSASLSITGPASADNYVGPTEFNLFQDNVYGTFMFFPIN